MACGCPVLTTGEPPMTEVAGNAAFFIRKRPLKEQEIDEWANESALVVEKALGCSNDQRAEKIAAGLMNAKRFDPANALNDIEALYLKIMKDSYDN